MKRSDNSPGVKVLDKAFALLEAVGASEQGRTLTELAAELALPTATVFRLLQHLVRRGYIEQDSASKHYHLGLRVLTLRASSIRSVRFATLARPHLRELMLATGCLAHLAVYRDGDIVYLDRVDTPSSSRILTPVGQRIPAHATALGKCLLAALSPAELDAVMSRGSLARRTANTLTDPHALAEHLQFVRKRGYAVDMEEATLGVWCLAAPIQDYTTVTVAAVSISMNDRPAAERIEELSVLVTECARRISREAGYRPENAEIMMELVAR